VGPNEKKNKDVDSVLDKTFEAIEKASSQYRYSMEWHDVGTVVEIGKGIVRVRGLPGVQSEELLRFPDNKLGMAFNLEENETSVVLLDKSEEVNGGTEVRRTGRVVDIPVSENIFGRILDPLGRPMDGKGAVAEQERLPVERKARGIIERLPVTVPLQTGIQAIDALIPIGRGQRELIIGDRQTGKTAIALDTIINQHDKNVICIYCAIGKETSTTAKVVADLNKHGAMDYTIVIATSGEDPAGLNFIAPYAATSIGEYFMEKGKDVLVVYDDLTRHAWAYRELSLLLRRPPAREAYPGDIFYIHSRLLERSTHLSEELGGGSLTAFPIIETQEQNLSAYIPTNLISITDGQVYLNPVMFQEGILPPVDIGKSVSRVGGKTQLAAYRAVAGDLRLSYSQFEELEAFARFGTRLDESTRQTLERGKRVREIFKQPQYSPIPVSEQIGVLVAVTGGIFDQVPLDQMNNAKEKMREAVREGMEDIKEKIQNGEKLNEEDQKKIISVAKKAIENK